jgi:hypothetical protein
MRESRRRGNIRRRPDRIQMSRIENGIKAHMEFPPPPSYQECVGTAAPGLGSPGSPFPPPPPPIAGIISGSGSRRT